MSLKQKVVTGISWAGISRILQIGIAFLTTLILARLLHPSDYGTVGMVTIFFGFISIFQDIGLEASIIRDTKLSSLQMSSIFWINFVLSIALGLLALASAPLISKFFDNPAVIPIAASLAAVFPLTSLVTVQKALWAQQMNFRSPAIIIVISTTVAGIIGITAAAAGVGVWALVSQQLALASLNLILFWIVSPWKPSLMFSWQAIRPQLNFGTNLLIGSLFNYGTRNTDDLLVGRMIGAEALGTYQMAYRLMLWPLRNVSAVVGEVLFPTLSSVKTDLIRLRQIFLRITGITAFVTFPLVLGLLVTAPRAIPLILGDQWQSVVPIFQILGILGLTQSITTNGGWILLSLGRSDLRLRLQVVFFLIYLLAFLLGIRWGLIGLAISYTVTSLLLQPVYFYIVGGLVGMNYLDILKNVWPILLCSASMALIVWGIGHYISWPALPTLILQVTVGVVVYTTTIHLFDIAAYRDTRDAALGYLRLKFRNSSSKIATP